MGACDLERATRGIHARHIAAETCQRLRKQSPTATDIQYVKRWHLTVLRNLGEDGSRPSELAARAGVTRQAVTKVVDELERLRMVRRDPDPDDGRGVIVRYTDRERAGLAIVRRRMRELEAEFPDRVGTARRADTRAVLEALLDDSADARSAGLAPGPSPSGV